MKTTITPHELADYRTCPRKYQLAHVYNLRRNAAPAAQRRGIAGNIAFAAIMQGADPETVLKQVCEYYADDPVQGEIMGRLILGYLWHYQNDRFQPIDIAQRDCKLLNPETGHASTTHQLQLTAKYAYKQDGLVYLLKHKFASTARDFSFGTPDYWHLRMDTELQYNLLVSNILGLDVVGYVVDVVKQPSIKPRKFALRDLQEIADNGTYCNERASGDLIRQCSELLAERATQKKEKTPVDIAEPPYLFGARLQTEIETNPEKFFQRVIVYLSQQELEEAANDIWQAYKSKQAGWYPRNPAACTTRGECVYLPICGRCADPTEPIDGYHRS